MVVAAAGAFDSSGFAANLGWSALGILLVLVATFIASRIAGKYSVIDTAWGVLFIAAAVATYISSSGHGDVARRTVLLLMTVLWGLRLAINIGRRSIGAGEDPRYAEMLKEKGPVETILLVYGLQGLLAFLVSMPLQVAMFTRGGLTVIAVLGLISWLVGLFFESVGDWQMNQFKAAKKRGELSEEDAQVMDTGLWRYTRHPNYFGDAAIWVGIYLVAAEHWPGVLTIFSPAIMVYLLAFGSGKKVLERSMAKRPGYREYMKRTSGFIPLPPRRG